MALARYRQYLSGASLGGRTQAGRDSVGGSPVTPCCDRYPGEPVAAQSRQSLSLQVFPRGRQVLPVMYRPFKFPRRWAGALCEMSSHELCLRRGVRMSGKQ